MKDQMNGVIVGSDIPRTRRLKIADLNPHLMCVLCGGYYIDATTIIECLHSFCRTCIVRYLETSKFCPICDVQVHKTKPLLSIRSDQTLQDIVYKLVPGLFQREMRKRREFYASNPDLSNKGISSRSSEERGEVENDFPLNIFMPDEFISVALEYSECGGISNSPEKEDNTKLQKICRRYFRCPVFITVAHIKKLIRCKYGLTMDHRVDVMFSQDNLNDDFMLMDIAYMYAWKRKGPLKLFFRMFDHSPKRFKARHYRPAFFGLERVNLVSKKLGVPSSRKTGTSSSSSSSSTSASSEQPTGRLESNPMPSSTPVPISDEFTAISSPKGESKEASSNVACKLESSDVGENVPCAAVGAIMSEKSDSEQSKEMKLAKGNAAVNKSEREEEKETKSKIEDSEAEPGAMEVDVKLTDRHENSLPNDIDGAVNL